MYLYDVIGEYAVLKNEFAEIKKSLQFHTDQWEESFKTLDNLRNELLQDLKEIKDKLNGLENLSRRNNLRIDGINEEENESWLQSGKTL